MTWRISFSEAVALRNSPRLVGCEYYPKIGIYLSPNQVSALTDAGYDVGEAKEWDE